MSAKKKSKTKSARKSARSSSKSARKAMRRCSICRKPGHNHRTCPRK